MIATLVQFKLPATMTQAEAKTIFVKVAPNFYGIPGLVRKYFLLSQESGIAGGMYLWRTQWDAQCFYTQGFKQYIIEQFGSEPSITFFESPVIVDNLVDEVIDCEPVESI